MRRIGLLGLIAVCAIGIASSAPLAAPDTGIGATHEPVAPLPLRLSDTGLFVEGSTTAVRADVIAFSPQYPLWSDGATKRRWIHLPPGTSIDASQPDAWQFPPGTRLWKEFSQGRRVETRLIERLGDGSWRYATYVWNEQGTDAALAPADGAVSAVASAPGGVYTIPSRLDCLACHEGGAVPVLGFSALQLSPDRDPLAPHAESPRTEHVDLRTLVARGLLRDPPASTLERPPRIEAPTATARAALGYLHGNCGHCHNAVGSLAGLDFVLAQSAVAPKPGTALGSLVDRSSRYRPRAGDESKRLVAGRADASVIAIRMQSTNPLARMPPLGVEVIDDEGVALVRRWIQHDVPQPAEVSP